MSQKEGIKGKVDSAAHDGRYSNTKRDQESEAQLREALADRAEEKHQKKK
jgi:hypothetical protein